MRQLLVSLIAILLGSHAMTAHRGNPVTQSALQPGQSAKLNLYCDAKAHCSGNITVTASKVAQVACTSAKSAWLKVSGCAYTCAQNCGRAVIQQGDTIYTIYTSGPGLISLDACIGKMPSQCTLSVSVPK